MDFKHHLILLALVFHFGFLSVKNLKDSDRGSNSHSSIEIVILFLFLNTIVELIDFWV